MFQPIGALPRGAHVDKRMQCFLFRGREQIAASKSGSGECDRTNLVNLASKGSLQRCGCYAFFWAVRQLRLQHNKHSRGALSQAKCILCWWTHALEQCHRRESRASEPRPRTYWRRPSEISCSMLASHGQRRHPRLDRSTQIVRFSGCTES
jgi:hypothetical protein